MSRNEKSKVVALYARYSSDVQKDTSIEDQFSQLERAAKRLGLKIDKRHYYSDRAVSATSLFERPGLTRDLLAAASRKEFNGVLVEATDRLSRNQADLFWLSDRFKFHNVLLFTPNGEVSDMQLTFDSHSNADFIKKLALRVKRGHDTMTREGKVAGGLCYGYDLVPGQSGTRVINEREAVVVRRIFTEYANGITPRKIVAGLHRDGIPSPTGAAVWNYQGIVGGDGTATGTGLLHRELYRGKIVRNRFRKVKNPENGKYINRKADEHDLIEVDAPHLRIIDDALWQRAHAVRLQRKQQMHPAGFKMKPTTPLSQLFLMGALRCASCHGVMTKVSTTRGGRVACSNANYRNSCDHVRSYDLQSITDEVIKRLESDHIDNEWLKEKAKAKAQEYAKQRKEENTERQAAQAKLDRLNLQIARLVDVLADGAMPGAEIKTKIKAKEAERVALVEHLRLLGPEKNVIELGRSISAFAESAKALAVLLRADPNCPTNRQTFANMIFSIEVYPVAKKQPYDLQMNARISAIQGVNVKPQQRTHQEIVAAEGVRKFGPGNNVTSSLSGPNNQDGIISLGRWRAAA